MFDSSFILFQAVIWHVKMEVPAIAERVHVNVQMDLLGLAVEVSAVRG